MFIKQLESLRGIAALMVALSHCLIVFTVDQNPMIWTTSLRETQGTQAFLTRLLLIPCNGGAAVTVFFVLSGYVLGLSLDRKPRQSMTYLAFYVKRVLRIYPAYLVCLTLIIASIMGFHTYQRFPNTSLWFQEWYQQNITWNNALANYALLETNLNQIAWTLKVELVMSFGFPLFYLLSRKRAQKGNYVILLILMALSCILPGIIYLLYGFVFYLGLMLPALIEKLKQAVAPSARHTLFLVSVIALLCARSLFAPQERFFTVLLEALAAATIIAILAEGTVKVWGSRLLDLPLVHKLGQISYSFYIYHFIIMYWLAWGLLHLVSVETTANYPLLLSLLLAVVSVPLTFVVAQLSYQAVERPMIGWGARLAEKVTDLARASTARLRLQRK
ncbi:acyltransferase [Gimesia sp.]|uniref:acyltransferase family protein n=1 Tax=Gimesia sp. TaxID=2024833 RepID=UPI0032EFBE42